MFFAKTSKLRDHILWENLSFSINKLLNLNDVMYSLDIYLSFIQLLWCFKKFYTFAFKDVHNIFNSLLKIIFWYTTYIEDSYTSFLLWIINFSLQFDKLSYLYLLININQFIVKIYWLSIKIFIQYVFLILKTRQLWYKQIITNVYIFSWSKFPKKSWF